MFPRNDNNMNNNNNATRHRGGGGGAAAEAEQFMSPLFRNLENSLVDREFRYRRADHRPPQNQRIGINYNNNNHQQQEEPQQEQELADPEEDVGGAGDGEERIIELTNFAVAHPEFAIDRESYSNYATGLWKHILEYHSVDIGKWTIPCMLAGWLLLFLPSSAMSTGESFLLRVDLFNFGLPLALAIASVVGVAAKRDIEFYRSLRTFEMRVTQMETLTSLLWLAQMMLAGGTYYDLFYFTTTRKEKFFEEIELVRGAGGPNFLFPLLSVGISNWGKINTQLFVLSFTGLLIVDVICTYWRMWQHSPVIAIILKYEFFAHVKPFLLITTPLLLLNEISFRMDPSKQTVIMWQCLFLVVFAITIPYTIYYVWKYPEIPLRRPIGVQGYFYMMWCTMFQLSVSLNGHIGMCLYEDLYFHVVPGALMESYSKPGLVLGPPLFYNQIAKGIPQEKWKMKRLFEPSFATFHGIIICIRIIRRIKLSKYNQTIRDRLLQLRPDLFLD